MILQSNKCLSVIRMNTADYITKIKSILNNRLRLMVDKFNKDLVASKKWITGMNRELLKRKMDADFTYNDLRP